MECIILDLVGGAGAGEVVSIDRPDHDAGQPVVLGVSHLQVEGDVVVEANPHVVPEHVGCLVGLLPHYVPRPGLSLLPLTDLQEHGRGVTNIVVLSLKQHRCSVRALVYLLAISKGKELRKQNLQWYRKY